MKIVHLITGLEVGGAETMLLKLLTAMDPASEQSRVISMIATGPMEPRFREAGIRLETLGMRRGAVAPAALPRLVRRLRELRPDVLQTWMYHADLLGALALPFARRAPGRPALVWNLRQTDLDPRLTRRGTRLIARLNALLSYRLPARILCCSQRTLEVHRALGYRRDLLSVIPNGFDTGRFRPDPRARAELRTELGIGAEAPLIGLVARFDPQKDPGTFVAAAARVRDARPEARFLVCGQGLDGANLDLTRSVAQAGLTAATRLLGLRRDTPRIFAALDLLVSSSAYGEGFPNVLGEAMACGVPCVATDVGDSGRIIADTGRLIPPRSPEALAAAVLDLLDEGGESLAQRGRAARARIESTYALPTIAATYGGFYRSLVREEPA